MDFHKGNSPGVHYLNTLGINSVSNILTVGISNQSFNLTNRYTPYKLIANLPLAYPEQVQIEPAAAGAVFRVHFYNSTGGSSGNIQFNTIYYARPLSSNTCKIYASAANALASSSPISLAGFQGARMYFMNAGYYINPAKAYATPHQCCPELAAINTAPVYTGCQVTFRGYTVECVLGTPPLFYYADEAYYSGSIPNYTTSNNFTGLLEVFVAVSNIDGNKKITIRFMQPLPGNAPFIQEGGFALSGTITGSAVDGATSVSYAFTTTGTMGSSLRIKLDSAAFMNGLEVLNVNLGSAPVLPTKLGLGDIDEILTFNAATQCYESSLKNYFNIPGRLTVPVDFYRDLSEDFPFPKWRGGSYVNTFDYGALTGLNYAPFSNQTFNIQILNPGYEIPGLAVGSFYADYNLEASSRMAFQYSFTENAVKKYLPYSSDIEPFYGGFSRYFYIGSQQPGSFFSTYRLT